MSKTKSKDLYEDLSEERKAHQADGRMPEWYTTGGWQMFKEKYLYDATCVREQFERIARTAAKHLRGLTFEGRPADEVGYERFFEMLWEGWLSPATPVLANMGTTRGMPVSCSGGVVEDSIDGFYSARHETACLTKNGFGTSAYLGGIRPRGSKISKGGKASGLVPVFKGFVQDMRDVAQGTARRGAWAGYVELEHGDFDELADFVAAEPDDANVGWLVTDAFTARLEAGDTDTIRRYQKALKLKMVAGKGYFVFIDKINRKRPQAYVQNGLFVKASNLCIEICLAASKDLTFTCVLSSLNDAKYRAWKEAQAAFWGTVFLDCVASEFIERATGEPGLEKAVAFTEKGRALGLGQCGFHTLLQQEMVPWESLQAQLLSQEIAKHIWQESERASRWLASELGEPEWCAGTGLRNTHRIAIAPTKSTALLMGGVSEGINPDPAMSFTQLTAAGEVDRVNPTLLALMKEKGVYTKKNIKAVKDAMGSVASVTWLTDEEKAVFKTAFEINQDVVVRIASARGQWVDQAQSINLFFSADEDPAWISQVHKKAFLDPNILGLYYITTQAGVQGSKGEDQGCQACQ
jgi:ribonucleoside-diphosphate reductase alpha chain